MRIEKGLLLKDWGLLKSQGKGIIYVMIGGAALMVGALNKEVHLEIAVPGTKLFVEKTCEATKGT